MHVNTVMLDCPVFDVFVVFFAFCFLLFVFLSFSLFNLYNIICPPHSHTLRAAYVKS